MKTIKYGIIGVGNMGFTHLKNFMKGEVPHSTVVAVADINPAKLKHVKEVYPNEKIEYYDSGEKLIDAGNVDAVLIATPHYFHPPLTIRALDKNISVVCEKPAGVYTKQVKEMNLAADRSKALFTIMFNQRTNCLYRKMREIMQSGGIGEIKRVNWIITNWYRSQRYYDSGDWRATWQGEGGGVLFNQCPHQLDLLQWVVGMMPVRVHAHCHFGKWHNIEVEDDVTAYFEYANGATGVFVTSTADSPGTNRFEINGSLGRLICEDDKLIYCKNSVDERKHCFETDNAYAPIPFETIEPKTDGQNLQHVGILRNFTNALLGLEPLFVKGQEGLFSVELMNAFLLSQWLGRTVELPVDDELYLAELNKRRATSITKSGSDVVVDLSGTYNGAKN